MQDKIVDILQRDLALHFQRKVTAHTALRVTAQLAANDMGIPFQQLIVHFLLQLVGIFRHKAKLVDGVGIGTQGEAVHRDLENSDQHGHGKADEIHSRAKGQANAGRGPNAGRRGKALYGAAVFKNHACAQKADAAHHLCGNTRRVGPACAVKIGAVQRGQVSKAVFGYDHQQSRGAAHDHMGADTGFFKALGALKADAAAAKTGRQNAGQKIQILQHGKLAVEILTQGHFRFSPFFRSDIK